MRIATGGICHETSTFAPNPTRLHDFENGFGIFRGNQVFERFAGTNTCTGGFMDAAHNESMELVPLLWTFAYPGGLIDRNDYETLKTELLIRLRKLDFEQPIDGVLLDLHGAMVVDGIEDGDGDVIAAVREAIGPRPLIVTQDLHGNHTPLRVREADAIVGYDTYPHVDMAERGREAGQLMSRMVRGEIQPVMAFRPLPMFWSAECQATEHEPMKSVMDHVHALESRHGILSITLATGFPWADVPQLGASVIVVADREQARAEEVAEELGEWVWQQRERFYVEPQTVAEGLEQGEREGKYPIILADYADNTGGGAPGDSTEILRTFLERRLSDALLLYLADPEVAYQAHQAGEGTMLDLKLGGKSDSRQGLPVEATCTVEALSDGSFRYDGPMYAGLTGELGPSARLRCNGVTVVVVSKREQPLDPAFARSLGIDCRKMRYIAVKSAVHFRSGFESLAGSIQNVNAAAIHSHDFRQLKYRRADIRSE